MRTAVLAFAALLAALPAIPGEGIAIPAPPTTPPAADTGVAVLAGGCFWGVQGVFQHVEGVSNATSGYAGGERGTARYRTVGTGRTGHAEAVEVRYDPRRISYGEILQVFFSVAHDPTERDRQGPDVGTQYRSAVFPQNAVQAEVARSYIARLDAARVFDGPVATTVEPGRPFYPAEAYHQDYLTLNPTEPYIVRNDLPKLVHLERLFPGIWRDDPALVSEAARPGS